MLVVVAKNVLGIHIYRCPCGTPGYLFLWYARLAQKLPWLPASIRPWHLASSVLPHSRFGRQQIVTPQMRACVGEHFSCCTNPGYANTNWSVYIISPALAHLSRLIVPPVAVDEHLWRQGFLWAWSNTQDTHGGKSFFNFKNRFGSTYIYQTLTIVTYAYKYGKLNSLWCMLRNSCCSNDRWNGDAIFFSSSSDKVSAVDLNSGIELGIQPMPGLTGDLKVWYCLFFHFDSSIQMSITWRCY